MSLKIMELVSTSNLVSSEKKNTKQKKTKVSKFQTVATISFVIRHDLM